MGLWNLFCLIICPIKAGYFIFLAIASTVVLATFHHHLSLYFHPLAGSSYQFYKLSCLFCVCQAEDCLALIVSVAVSPKNGMPGIHRALCHQWRQQLWGAGTSEAGSHCCSGTIARLIFCCTSHIGCIDVAHCRSCLLLKTIKLYGFTILQFFSKFVMEKEK